MGATNYNLPQWNNGDEFHVIGQLNPAFATIDSPMKDAASAADSAGKQAADNGVIVTLGVVNG